MSLLSPRLVLAIGAVVGTCVSLGCTKKEGPDGPRFVASPGGPEQGARRPATVVSIEVAWQNDRALVTLSGLLSEDCNALLAEDNGPNSLDGSTQPAYAIDGTTIRLFAYEYFSEDAACRIVSPSWERQVTLPELRPGRYVLSANDGTLTKVLVVPGPVRASGNGPRPDASAAR